MNVETTMKRLPTLLVALVFLAGACASEDTRVTGVAISDVTDTTVGDPADDEPAADGDEEPAPEENPDGEEPEPDPDESEPEPDPPAPDPEPDPDPPAPDPAPDPDPDPDEPIQFGPYPVGTLTFEVTDPFGTTDVYTVSCLGDTATLSGANPDGLVAHDMCLRLGEPDVQERLIDGVPDDLACTLQFGSEHVARVGGTLENSPVEAEFHRRDGCGIFDWDSLMQDVLPAV